MKYQTFLKKIAKYKTVLFFILIFFLGFIVELPLIIKGKFLKEFLFLINRINKSPSLLHFLKTGNNPLLNPLFEFFFYTEYKIFGYRPSLFYIMHYLLNFTVLILMFIFLKLKKFNLPTIFITILIFLTLFSPYKTKLFLSGSHYILTSIFIFLSVIMHNLYNEKKKIFHFSLLILCFHFTLYTNGTGVVLLLFMIVNDIFEKRFKENISSLYIPLFFITGFYLFLYFTNFSVKIRNAIPYKIGVHTITNIFRYYIYLFFPTATSFELYSTVSKFQGIFYLLLIFNFLSASTLPIFILLITKEKNKQIKIIFLSLFLSFIPFLPFTGKNLSKLLYLPSIFFSVIVAHYITKINKEKKKLPKITIHILTSLYIVVNYVTLLLVTYM